MISESSGVMEDRSLMCSICRKLSTFSVCSSVSSSSSFAYTNLRPGGAGGSVW